MHEREEMYSMWGPDTPHVPPATALNHFAIAFSGFVAFGFLCKYVLVPDRPAVPRQYPFDGLVRELGGIEEIKVGLTHLCLPSRRSHRSPFQANVESLEEDD
jgi:NADH dehydrogenase (ubiquinone) 1 beta subcomplex subunit 8